MLKYLKCEACWIVIVVWAIVLAFGISLSFKIGLFDGSKPSGISPETEINRNNPAGGERTKLK